MTQLSVNVNKIALLRNTRTLGIPSVTRLARIALDAGANGITIHPRPDQRHIRPHDIDDLNDLIRQTPYGDREFNIEGNPFQNDYVATARKIRPDQCTLVPDEPGAATSDHGWDVAANCDRLTDIVAQLKDAGCRVSLFMDPDPLQIELAAKTGADRIELYTEPYAKAYGTEQEDAVFEQFLAGAKAATDAGLGINAGHDLNMDNLARFAGVPGLLEVSIGHALTADALEWGLAATVRAYLAAMRR